MCFLYTVHTVHTSCIGLKCRAPAPFLHLYRTVLYCIWACPSLRCAHCRVVEGEGGVPDFSRSRSSAHTRTHAARPAAGAPQPAVAAARAAEGLPLPLPLGHSTAASTADGSMASVGQGLIPPQAGAGAGAAALMAPDGIAVPSSFAADPDWDDGPVFQV